MNTDPYSYYNAAGQRFPLPERETQPADARLDWHGRRRGREPGLAPPRKFADYYRVSADYLMGRNED